MEKVTINAEIDMSRREIEIFRTLRTNIEFTGVENRVIAVTSCMPNDGKSTVAFNMACTEASASGGSDKGTQPFFVRTGINERRYLQYKY